MEEEIGWVELTHQAVQEGMELYLSFLNDPDLQLRMATTYLLASFQEDQARLAPRLQAYLVQETDERMIACLLLSLGQLLPAIADSPVLLMPYLIAGNTPLVRLCAAMALSFLMREAIPEEVVLIFCTFLTDPDSVQAAYDELPRTWTVSTVPFDALDFLRWLTPSQHRSLIIGKLVDLLPSLHGIIASEVADHLLHVAFYWEEFELPPQVTRENLNAEQRNKICGRFWHCSHKGEQSFESIEMSATFSKKDRVFETALHVLTAHRYFFRGSRHLQRKSDFIGRKIISLHV